MGYTNKEVTMTNNKCRKFQSNIFNKSRCQNCFKAKDEHSAEALESSRASRKVCLCGYLFVAPDVFDFSNPMDRTKRWQRRFFVLYDSGELIYSVDENVGTIPQAEINMNVCSEVFDAQPITSHQFSIGIAAQGGVTYIKGTSNDEISRWRDMLLTFSQSKPVKPRNLSLPAGIALRDLPSNMQIENNNTIKREESRESLTDDVRRNTSQTRVARRSTHDSSQIMTGRSVGPERLQNNGDESGRASDRIGGPLTYRGVRNLKHRGDKSFGDLVKKTSSLENLSVPNSESIVGRVLARSESGDRSNHRQSMSKTVDKLIETQEESEKSAPTHVKKGWLFKEAADKSWPKYWVILTESSLLFYSNVKAEITDSAEDIVLLSSHSSLVNVDYSRNYGFRISNGNYKCVLAAITFSLRSSWMQSISDCIDSLKNRNSLVPPESPDSSTIPSSRLTLLCVTATQKENRPESNNAVYLNSKPKSSWPFSSPVPPPPPTSALTDDYDIPSSSSTTDSSRQSLVLSSSHSSDHLENRLGVVRPISQIQQQPISKEIVVLAKTSTLSSQILDDAPRRRRRVARPGEADTDLEASSTASSVVLDDMMNQHIPATHRAPSTKIRERTRNKSPKRVRSPPPSGDLDVGDGNDMLSDSSREFEQIALNNSLIERLEAEIRSLKNKLSNSLKDSETKDLEMESLQQRISEFHQSESVRDSKLVIRQMGKALEDSGLKIEAQADTIELKTEELQDLESQLQLSEKQIVRLNTDAEKSNNRLLHKDETIATLKKELAETKRVSSELDILRKQLKENDNKMEQLQRTCLERVRNAENDRETIEIQLRELENKLSIVEKEKQTAENKKMVSENGKTLAELEEKLLECNSKLQMTADDLLAEQEKGKQLLDIEELHKKEMSDLVSKLKDSEKQVVELQADIKHVRQEQVDSVKAINETKTENILLQKDLDSVEKKMMELREQSESQQYDITKLNDALKLQKDMIDSKDQEILLLSSSVAATGKECENCHAMKQEMGILQADMKALRNQLTEKDVKLDQYDKMVSQVELLQKRLEGTQEELKCCQTDAEEDVQNMEKVIEELTAKCGSLVKDLQESGEKVSVAVRSEKDMKEELESARRQFDYELEGRNFELASAERKIEDLESQIKVIKEKESEKTTKTSIALTSTVANSNDDESRVVSELKQKINRMEIAHEEGVAQLNTKLQEASTKLAAAERRNERLERCKSGGSVDIVDGGEIRHTAEEFESLSSQIRQLEEKLLSSENDRKILQEQILSSDNSESKLQKISLEKDSLISANEELVKQLKVLEQNSADVGDGNVCADQAQDSRIVDDLKAELRRKETSYSQELQTIRDGYEIRIRSLQCDLSATRSELNKCQLDRDETTLAYEKRLSELESEVKKYKCVRARSERSREREGHLETLRRAESVPYSHQNDSRVLREESEVTALTTTIDQLTLQLEKEKKKHREALERLRLDASPELLKQLDAEAQIRELEEQIHSMQVDYEQELAMQKSAHRRELAQSKEDVLHQLATAEANSIPINEESIRRKYLKEVDRVKEIYDRGFSTMEKSNQRTMMEMRRNHKLELEKLRAEKDLLLMEETKATQAALDAMRKAHETELEEERKKFLDLISKTYSHADMESLHRQHEEDLQLIQYEIRQVSEQYTIKCLENAALSDRLSAQTKALCDSRGRVQDLLVRNEELTTRLKYDIEKLNRLLTKRSSVIEQSDSGPDSDELKVVLQVKEAEITQMKEELAVLTYQLNVKSEELVELNEKYVELYNEQLNSSRRSIDSLNTLDTSKLRRSFDSIRESDRFAASDADHLGSADDLGTSNSGSETSLLKIDEASFDESGAKGGKERETGVEGTRRGSELMRFGGEEEIGDDPIESILPRRSLWRIRNPQRARSSPAGPDQQSLQKFSADRQQSLLQ